MEYGADVKERVQEKGEEKEKGNIRYHVQVEEVEDEHWAKR